MAATRYRDFEREQPMAVRRSVQPAPMGMRVRIRSISVCQYAQPVSMALQNPMFIHRTGRETTAARVGFVP